MDKDIATAQYIIRKLRDTTLEDFNHVLEAYGSSYANGWRFGRDRAADIIEREYIKGDGWQ